VIAAWPDGWVVDSLVCTPTGCTMRQASPVLGLVPWREHAIDSAAAQAWLLAIGTTPAHIDSTTRLMRARRLVAVARDVSNDVRVVLAGGMRAEGSSSEAVKLTYFYIVRAWFATRSVRDSIPLRSMRGAARPRDRRSPERGKERSD
jgi:hypothetical protein